MNNCTVTGNVGGKVTLRQTTNGENVLSFSVADNQIGKDAGGAPLPPIWWNCALWGKRAVALQPYITKGTPVTVVGRASMRQYQAQDGTTRTSLELRVQDLALQGRAEGRAEGAAHQAAAAPAAKMPAAQLQAMQQAWMQMFGTPQGAAPMPQAANPAVAPIDDGDIPF